MKISYLCLYCLSLFLGYLIPLDQISAQQVYTLLQEKKQIQSFTRVSENLICQCGCAMALNVCPHVECHWGIPSRRLIEAEILTNANSDLEGQEEKIIGSFVSGFPSARINSLSNSIDFSPEFQDKLKQGYGSSILAKKNPLPLFLFLTTLFILALFFILQHWRKSSLVTHPTKNKATGTASKKNRKLLEDYRNLDQ